MHRHAFVAAALALCVVVPLFGQGRPGNPNNPLTETPQTVVDSTGKLVGDVLKVEGQGLASASVRYVLPDSEHVLLNVNGQSITHIGSPVPPANSAATARVFFMQADCSGQAYLRDGIGPARQLTKLQAMTIGGILLPAAPPPNQSCPVAHTSHWLYTAAMDAFNCPLRADPGNAVTFQAYYGFDVNAPPTAGLCTAVPGGITIGGPSGVIPFGSFVTYTRVEDLFAKYKAPFFIP